jgi:inorganic pyrophosphatase
MSTLTCNNPALSNDEIAKGSDITAIVVSCGGMGLLWALIYAYQTARISIAPGQGASTSLLSHEESVQNGQTVYDKVRFVSEKIAEGANAFLMREYSYIFGFMLFFSVVIILVIGGRDTWVNGVLTAIAFFVGGLTSLLSGYIGMKIAVFSNSRTCYAAVDGRHRPRRPRRPRHPRSRPADARRALALQGTARRWRRRSARPW